MSTDSKKVLIVGAGPAGMTLAYLLARRGIDVTVLESHQDFARSFRGEGLLRSGIDAFRQMGLAAQLDKIPSAAVRYVTIYQGGKLRVRADAAGLGRQDVRMVSQPAILQMLYEEASNYPGFRLERGVTVRDLIFEDDRVTGIRASVGTAQVAYHANLIVGSDGRHAITRKRSGFSELTTAQAFDVVWFKVPMPEEYPDATALTDIAEARVAVSFPSADGQLQIGFIIPKGGFKELREHGLEKWSDVLIGQLPQYMADHLRAHRDLLGRAALLDVVCGCLTQWSRPGLLLIGDAAHPMSPVGGQGVNLALRDALVAANHLCPALESNFDDVALDAAARHIQDERLPEINIVQKLQTEQAKLLFTPDNWRTRFLHSMLPLLVKTGLLQMLHRKQYHQMSNGVVKVKLDV